MGGLFGDPWNPGKVVEPDLLKTGANQTPTNEDPSPDEAIIAYINSVAAGLQPHDSDLDAIAALATTSFGRGFLALVDAAAARAYIGAGSGGGLTDGDYGDIVVSGTGTVMTIDSAILSTFIRTLLDDANAAAAQATLGLTIGTNVQAFDSDLAAIAALSTTSFGRSLLALADAAALRTAAGLVIGTDVQAHDADLDAIAALTTTAYGRSLLTAANAAGLQTLAGLVIGTNVQAWDADLDAIAALTTASFGRSLLTAASAAAAQTTLGLVIGTNVQAFDSDLASIAALATTSFGRGFLVLADAAATRTYIGAVSIGGSDRQLQFNNAGALAGATGVDIDADGDLRMDIGGVTAPGADQVAFKAQRIAASGGRVLPRWGDESGVFSTLQPHIGRNSIMQMQGLGSAVNPTLQGGVVTFLGTVTARGPATTNRATRSKRTGYVSAATAGSTAGFYTPSAQNQPYTLGSAVALGGGGFLAVFRWVASDAAAVAGAHMFIGMRTATVAPVATASPTAFTNDIGVAQIAGGANLNIVHGGSAAQAAIDLGANFPAAGLSTDIYELILYAPPNSNNSVSYRVERINTGDVASGVLTGTAGTQMPANTTLLGPTMFRSNNATALAVGLDIVGMYLESDI